MAPAWSELGTAQPQLVILYCHCLIQVIILYCHSLEPFIFTLTISSLQYCSTATFISLAPSCIVTFSGPFIFLYSHYLSLVLFPLSCPSCIDTILCFLYCHCPVLIHIIFFYCVILFNISFFHILVSVYHTKFHFTFFLGGLGYLFLAGVIFLAGCGTLLYFFTKWFMKGPKCYSKVR